MPEKDIAPSKQKATYFAQLPSNARVKWTPEHTVVSRLQNMMINPPISAYPDFNLPFELNTDASNEGLRPVLYQQQEVKLHVITFGSRTLTFEEETHHLLK